MPVKKPLFALLLGLITLPTFGQATPSQMPPMDPAMVQRIMNQIQQRILDNVKTQLDASDEEFQVLQPKLQKLLQLRFLSFMSTGMGTAFAGPMARFNSGPPTALQKAATDLQNALDNRDSSIDSIGTKVAALRTERTRLKAEISQAQDDLRQLLTQRQEATLVTMNFLD